MIQDYLVLFGHLFVAEVLVPEVCTGNSSRVMVFWAGNMRIVRNSNMQVIHWE